jgi:hypothetical protein
MLNQFDLEIPFFSGKAVNLRKRQQFDVVVPADLDQFR